MAEASHAARFQGLDALRGIAILLVVGFHFLSRWAERYPYGERYADFPLFSQGFIGVQLFFMISGFVIYLTLLRTRTLPLFLARRWLRLAPAMVVGSLILFATAAWLPLRPDGQPGLVNLLPGLLFSDVLAGWLVGHPVAGIEGAFWSLYVEFQFYLLIALIHYGVGQRHDWRVFFALVLLLWLASWLSRFGLTGGMDMAALTRAEIFLPLALPWFLIGIMAYRWQRGEGGLLLLLLAVLLALSWPGANPPWRGSGALKLVVKALTIAAFLWVVLAPPAWLASRVLLFFGFVSYPLYLVHENLGVALILQAGEAWPALPSWLLPASALAVTATLAWLLARFVEPPLQKKLGGWLS